MGGRFVDFELRNRRIRPRCRKNRKAACLQDRRKQIAIESALQTPGRVVNVPGGQDDISPDFLFDGCRRLEGTRILETSVETEDSRRDDEARWNRGQTIWVSDDCVWSTQTTACEIHDQRIAAGRCFNYLDLLSRQAVIGRNAL